MAELAGPREVAAEALRSELSVAVAGADKAGIAALVADEEDDYVGCDGNVVTDAAVDAAASSTSSAEWKQCGGGEETWQSEKPSDLQRAC